MLQCIKYICVVLAPLDYLLVFGADFLCVCWRQCLPGVPNPLHRYRMIVFHICNISDVCGISQDLLLKGAGHWG